jgi:uncharacterized SAM-binding protein YcdF (DUF218 family)
VAQNEVRSLRLVTTDWHMRRTAGELDRTLPDHVTVILGHHVEAVAQVAVFLLRALDLSLQSAAALVCLFIILPLSVLAWAVTFSALLSSRISAPIPRSLAGALISILSLSFFQVVLLRVFWVIFMGVQYESLNIILISTISALSLVFCAPLWRRWIRQGDAWFRLREE